MKILITGASTGIGAAAAIELAAGNHLYIHYNNSKKEAEAVAAKVEELGGKAELCQANLMDAAGCEALFNDLSAKTDALDVLVNNAGGLIERHDIDSLSWSLIERIFALNTFSTMYMTSLCTPLLKQGADACIVNVTSVAMRFGSPTSTIYAASKGAIDTFTRGSALELAPGIRVNAIAPGVILTPFHDRYTSSERLEMLKDRTPLKKHGEAEHIATAVRYLIENTFITGETLDINGGLSMR